jgi:Tol biopolymer transport system component
MCACPPGPRDTGRPCGGPPGTRTGSVRGIYTVRSSDGGKLQRLTTGVQVPCGWSPDGSHLAYLQPVHGDEDRSFLHIVATDGSGTSQRVGSQLYSGLWCDWSPVDQTILTEQDGLLWLVSLDGSQTRST